MLNGRRIIAKVGCGWSVNKGDFITINNSIENETRSVYMLPKGYVAFKTLTFTIGAPSWYSGLITSQDKSGASTEYSTNCTGSKLLKHVTKFSKLYSSFPNLCNAPACLSSVCSLGAWRDSNCSSKAAGAGSWICPRTSSSLSATEALVRRLRSTLAKGLPTKKLLINKKSIGRPSRRNFTRWLTSTCIARTRRRCPTLLLADLDQCPSFCWTEPLFIFIILR